MTLLSLFPSWLWHPLGLCTGTARQIQGCKGYAFWSGIGSDFGEITLFAIFVTGAVTAWRLWHSWKERHECHVEGCHKLAWHPHPDHGHPVCKLHHPDYGHEKLSLAAHADAGQPHKEKL